MKLGIIGFGIMGERLTRAAHAHPDPEVAVAGVWDPSSTSMERLAASLPDIDRFGSVEDLIAASDCVYIASPPETHLAYARAAIKEGKSVFCEKPLAVNVEDARDFVAEADGARAAVNFVFASSPAVAQLRTWISEGVVGSVERLDIEMAFALWPRPWQHDASSWLSFRDQGGFTREVASHFLFLTRRMLGEIEVRKASVTYPGLRRRRACSRS